MIFDKTLLFSDAQAITADAASTNVIDLRANGTVYGATGALRRDLGKGTRTPLFIGVVEAFNNLTSMVVSIQTDDNEAFSSAKTVASFTLLLADLTLGKQIPLDMMPLGSDERYIRLYYDITGTAPTLGKVTAGFTAGNQTN